MVTNGSQTYHGDTFIMYKNIESIYYTAETSIILLSQLYFNKSMNNKTKKDNKKMKNNNKRVP